MIVFPRLGQTGRLGNQLWQIASTLGVAAARQEEVSFPAWDYQPFFSLPAEMFRDEKGIDTTECVPQLDERVRVYLQDFSLWRDIAGQIQRYLKPSALAEKIIRDKKYDWFYELHQSRLAVHVRRGDNAYDPGTPNKHEYHPMPTLAYYQEALARYPDDVVVVFSDDIPWCRENFVVFDREIHYMDGSVSRPKEHEPEYASSLPLDWPDMQFMARCEHHVIANSTYSWWSAFLSGDPAPIYPLTWFGPLLDYINWKTQIPEGWQGVPC